MAKKAKKILKVDIGSLIGLQPKQCRAVCDLVIFAARGMKARRWETKAQAKTAIAAEGKARAIDPATIAMIVEMIMAMLEQKQ